MPERYRTIVADPPWAYDDPFGGYNSASGNRLLVRRKLPYESMTVEEIAALPVAKLADPAGANLFLWTTNRYLPSAFDVMKAWGATYRQMLLWSKTGANPNTGSIAPTSCEFLLYGRIGNGAPIAAKWPHAVITTKRLSASHSRKPDVFLDLIEQSSPEPRVELFARRARMMGWDYWGDQSHGTADVAA